MRNLARLRSFIHDMTRLVERHGADEQRMLDEAEKLLRGLIAQDDWLPEEFARPEVAAILAAYYQREARARSV